MFQAMLLYIALFVITLAMEIRKYFHVHGLFCRKVFPPFNRQYLTIFLYMIRSANKQKQETGYSVPQKLGVNHGQAERKGFYHDLFGKVLF